MASTDAGTPAAGNGGPPSEPEGDEERDGGEGASAGREITYEEAIEIAKENASFEPCSDVRCAQARFIQRGIPPRAYWGVVLYKELDEQGQPTGEYESFLVDAATGAVSRP